MALWSGVEGAGAGANAGCLDGVKWVLGVSIIHHLACHYNASNAA